ncbi:Ras GTPase [Tieghemostelium lacteum]|uniref:small monomeric GTPase n=1 Tax=Tieghemostelium lacteum TaxID=361077 RepID=A0A151ZA50_TIELA|nr:Ras GTPase [Tieghemostelium lacteum]|eukprot:KYQ90818.1 Ras GTPase [Tieghemostelium lacteum]
MGKKDKEKADKSSANSNKNKFFVAVMGAGSVGKSALTVQFTQGIFVDKYDPTVEDTYQKTLELDGDQVTVEVLDTAGSEVLVAMRELYMKSAEGFILVYSIIVKSTFYEIQDIVEQLFRVKDEDEVPIVLVGNKIDLDSHREVSTQDGKQLAASYPNCDFYEASSKERINVDNVFFSIIRRIKEKYKKEGPPTKEKKEKCIIM